MPNLLNNLPQMPQDHCFQAGLARLFVEIAAKQSDTVAAAKIEDLQSEDALLVESRILGTERRIQMASDYLMEYLGYCATCTNGEVAEICPMQNSFDFVRSISEVHLIK